MITTHAEALEGLRMALAQLHDVRLYMADQPDSEHSWAAGVAYDWVRTAIYYGEEQTLSEVLAAMHSGIQDIGITSTRLHCDFCGDALEESQIGLCDHCQSHEANVEAARELGFTA